MNRYIDEVRTHHFSEPDHVYGVEPAELAELRRYVDQESLISAKAWDWEPFALSRPTKKQQRRIGALC